MKGLERVEKVFVMGEVVMTKSCALLRSGVSAAQGRATELCLLRALKQYRLKEE